MISLEVPYFCYCEVKKKKDECPVMSAVLGANLQMSVESILHGGSLRELLVKVADFCFTPS